jgi:hypothetical protein
MVRRRFLFAWAVVVSSVAAQAAFAQQPLPSAAEENKIFKADVGTWDATVSIYPAGPDGPVVTSKGTETNRQLTEGTWLITEFKADLGGLPYAGHGLYGYDAAKKKYVGTWVDSMSAQLTVMEGDYDADTKTMTLFSEGIDPATGQKAKMKYVGRVLEDGSRDFTLSQQNADGEFAKMMHIAYTRKK